MQALKDVALRLLNVYVSPYVENLNPHDLSVSVFGGNLQFNGLHLKKSLLERFGVPVEIVAGDIGSLSVTIPWTQLKTQPVKIVINDVYVLAKARPQGKVDPEEDERIEQATKQEKLRSAEEVDNAAVQVRGQGGSDESKQTYVGAIVSKVVDNVQVHIKNIHVRYEDRTSTPEHPFAAGITLSEFKAVSTDGNWVEAFIQDSLQGVHKLVKLGALSVYFDTDTGSLDRGPDDRQGTLDALNAMLMSENDDRQYIMRPVTGEARVILNHQMSNETPKVDAQVIFDEIGVTLDRDQYRDTLSMIDVIHFYRRTHQYHKFRPPEEAFKESPAKARWKFATSAISSEVHERHKRWTWDYIAQRRDLRKKYVEIYAKKLGLPEGRQLPVEDGATLAEMEKDLSYEDIRYFRSVARAQAKKDAATRRKLEIEQRKNQPQRQTWSEWLWGVPKVDESGMTEEERKELDDIIDYDRAAAPTIGNTPKDFMKARVSATLNRGSFTLRTEPHGDTTDIISLVFDSFSADFLQLTESLSGKLALGGFRVYDGTTKGSVYPQIVRVKDIERSGADSEGKDKGKTRQSSLDDGDGMKDALQEIDDGMAADADPFFVLELEQNPLDGHADSALTVKMRHLEIIYHRGYVEAVVHFFKPPASQLESIGALLDAAGQTLDGIRKETRAGLEYALEQHKTVDLRVDMNAPIIVIPMDIEAEDSQALVLDAGHIAVESQLADQSQLKEVQSKRGRQYSDDDFKQLENLMYDKFSLRLESTQLLMGPNVESCMKAIEDPHIAEQMDLHLLERINMSFSVQNAITNAPTLARFKIAGELPELQVNFSDRKYKTLMRFIDVAVPKFDEDDSAEAAPRAPQLSHGASFRQQPIEEYTLDDTRSMLSQQHDDKDDKDDRDDSSSMDDKVGEKFFEAPDDTTDTQRRDLQQITFQFSFSVGRLQTSLFKSISPTDERPLANAALEGFGLTFELRKYDMSVDLYLRSVILAMIESGKPQQALWSSTSKDSPDGEHKLLRVRYEKVQKDSPEFMTVHEGVDQNIDVDLSTFRISVAPEPILNLYDFIMTTFVPKDENSPGPPRQTRTLQDGTEAVEEAQAVEETKSNDKLRVRVKVINASVSLENNETRFALLSLPSADVVIILRSGTLRVAARLGDLTLTSGKSATLLSIEGEELADFSYETFDPTDKETFPGYNSSVNLKAGSLKFTFLEEPIRDIYVFAMKFARMKAIYDAASQAAAQRASEVTRMHYDIVVSTPIIVLPTSADPMADKLVLRLGEIVAKNQYLGDPDDSSTIEASLSGINVTSEMVVEDEPASVQIMKDVTINANVKQIGNRTDQQSAETEVTTKMSDVQMSLTQRQYGLLMSTLQSLPKALSDIEEDDIPLESIPGTPARSISQTPTPGPETPNDYEVDLEPELSVHKGDNGKAPELGTKLKVDFTVGSIGLEVFGGQAHRENDLHKHSIARFELRESRLTMQQLTDASMELSFTLRTISFSNTSVGKSVHREIIPAADHDSHQLVVSYTVSGGPQSSALAIVTVDSPRLTLAVEPLAALAEFAVSPFMGKEAAPEEAQENKETQEVAERPPQNASSLAFRVEIVNSVIIVVADDSDPKSQAIYLNVKEVLISQQAVMALKVDKLGMSFGRMDGKSAKDRVKFLDELNVALSLDTRRKGAQQMTSFDVDIPDPIIFRASYTDIMLILDIVNKATAAAQRARQDPETSPSPKERRPSMVTDGITEVSSKAVSTVKSARRSSASARNPASKSQVLVSKEQLKAKVNGFQLVLVGDLQELPLVHLSTPEFEIAVNDWSGDMSMATSLRPQIRYFNLTNSYFEPLMDPWTFNLRVNRTTTGSGGAPLSVRFTAAERLELNLTSAFIELAITAVTLWTKDAERVKNNRGNDAPFRIRNETGLPLLVWPEQRDLSKPVHGVKRIEDGADVQWRFEDRKYSREHISTARHNALGVKVENTEWDYVRGISVDRSGEYPQTLRPKIDKVSHQLMCEIRLEDNIKVITFRSTLSVENQTSLPVELVVVDSHGKAWGGAIKIDPGQSCPLPLEAVYEKRFRIRPLRGFGFDYSWSMPLHWKQLVARPIRPVSCKHQTPNEPAFYFQAQANFDPKDPSTRVYPKMKLVLRAPVELENLLPYDIKFRIHDKNTGLSSSNFLVKGGASPIHTVELSHLLLLSVAPEDTNFKQSDYAIINTDDPELPIEKDFHLADQQGLKLTLKLHYFTYPKSGGAFKVQIYSPFVFLNKTGLPFDLAAKTWTGGQRPVAGGDLFKNDHNRDTPTPFMLAFPNEDRRNRLFLKVDDSKWSKPLSFEPVAADMQVVMGGPSGESDFYVGMSYAEGLGKYKLTKVITIAPRFMVKNMFSYGLKIRQRNTQNVISLAPGGMAPVHQLQSRAPMQFSMSMDEPNLKWTAPFNVADIGRTNLTLDRETNRGNKIYLMRVETHIEGSTIFLYISRETEPWPLKLENQTKVRFSFQQVNAEAGSSKMPVRDLAANSTVDYAWDYPDAQNKRIRLMVDGIPLPKDIDMMAIGIQPPVKIGRREGGQRSTVLSLDIQADGSSQLLVISPYNEDTSVYKPSRKAAMRRSESTDSIAGGSFETVAVSEKANLSVTVELEGIGISIITKRLDELLYLSLRGLKIGYSDYPQYYDAFIDCKWIQIDNQLFGGLFPIILYPTVVPKDGKELESHPTLQTSVAVLKDQSHGVYFIKYATILLQAMTIELDEDFVFALLDFVKFEDAAWKEPPKDVLIEHPKDIPEPDIANAKADIFFEALQLQPMSLELSFMRTDRVNVDEKVSTRNPFYFALNALTMTLGNVNAAPVNFRALFLENSRLSVPSLMERVQLHYQEQFMAQLFRVLGSADFLGNPVGLFNNISSGFSDIFYEPYQGMVMHGNKDIGLGIARGATSFAKKTVFGITDSMTKFTSSLGKGLSAATLDSEYQNKRRMTQRRNKPKHALYGVAAGASAFADSVTSAFEGVASKPMEGAERDGAAGFAKGVGKGFVGLFTKPVVGVMDFVSASTEGIRNTTTVFDQADLDRVRLPRHIGSDGVLRPFNAREALGQSWLKELDAGAYFTESYVAHLDIPGDDAVAILSNNRLLYVQLRKLRVIWQVPFEDVQSLSLESTGIVITLRGGTPGPFLPVSEQTGREWFFKQIGKVVVTYNKVHAQRDD